MEEKEFSPEEISILERTRKITEGKALKGSLDKGFAEVSSKGQVLFSEEQIENARKEMRYEKSPIYKTYVDLLELGEEIYKKSSQIYSILIEAKRSGQKAIPELPLSDLNNLCDDIARFGRVHDISMDDLNNRLYANVIELGSGRVSNLDYAISQVNDFQGYLWGYIGGAKMMENVDRKTEK